MMRFIYAAACSVHICSAVIAEDTINLFYASDEGYAIPTCVSIASILKNASEEDKFQIFIFDLGLSEKSKQAIKNLSKIKKFNLIFRTFDQSKLKVFKVGKWNTAIRIKLFVHELFPDIKRVMWVNGNTIVRGRISELYNKDLHNKYFAAGEGRSPFYIQVNQAQAVCDCLVLYNIPLMSKDRVFDRIINYVKQVQDKDFAYAGENALVNIDANSRRIFTHNEFSSIDMSDIEGRYVSPNSIVLKYSERYGYGPWRYPRFLYPEMAIDSYYEWHKYCDLTDYKGLRGRLTASISDYFMYYLTRLKRLYMTKRRKLKLKVMSIIKGAKYERSNS